MDVKFLMCKKCGCAFTTLTCEGHNLECCGEKMVELHATDTEGSGEKHKPKVSRHEGTVRVDVGEVTHPMEDKHFIEWICLQTRRGGQFVRLKASEQPRATFGVSGEVPGDEPIAVYAYCNQHGLWKTDV